MTIGGWNHQPLGAKPAIIPCGNPSFEWKSIGGVGGPGVEKKIAAGRLPGSGWANPPPPFFPPPPTPAGRIALGLKALPGGRAVISFFNLPSPMFEKTETSSANKARGYSAAKKDSGTTVQWGFGGRDSHHRSFIKGI